MKPPVLEFRLILLSPGNGWEFVARQQGEVIAASDGDTVYENAGKALVACAAEVRGGIEARKKASAGKGAKDGG